MSRFQFRHATTLGVLTAALLSSHVAQADISRVGTYLQVGSGAIGEMHPDVAYSDKSNAYLVVWGDGGGGGTRPAYAQLVSAGGALVGARLQLTSCGGELYGQRPRVAYSAGSTDDVFVVIYREWCSKTVNIWAHIVRYSASGAVSGGRVSIRNTGVPGGIVYNAARKEFVGVWEELVSGTGYDVVGRVITLARDGGGAVTGFGSLPAAIAIGVYSKTQGRPRIALDPTSQSYFIAFQGENPSTGANAMMYRTLDAASGALSGLLYAAQGGYNVESSVVFLPEVSQFLVTWRQGTDVVGRRFAPVTGAPVSTTYPLIARPGTDGATGAGYDPSVDVGMVAGMNSDYYVWASEFSSTGAHVSTFIGSTAPPSIPGGGTFFPQVAPTGSGNFGLAYGIDYKRVYLERFAGAGGTPPPPPPPTCSVSVTGSSASFTAAGGIGSVTVNVTTPPCNWSASSNVAWIQVSPGSGTSSGTVSYTVLPNLSSTSGRSGVVTVGGQNFTITQTARSSVLADFDGDGQADPMFYRSSNGTWYARLSSTGATESLGWSGLPGDIPLLGDFDGDTIPDPTFFRPSDGCWYILSSSTQAPSYICWGGMLEDKPVPADYDGDGKTDAAFYRPSERYWYILQSSTNTAKYVFWGGSSADIPAPADFDGDKKADVAFYRPTDKYWYIIRSSNWTAQYILWGTGAGDVPVPADYDGDGKADVAYFRPAQGYWYIKQSVNNASRIVYWGNSLTNKPVPADYDGDRKADVAFFEAPYFYIIKSTTGLATYYTFGSAGDVAVTK